MRWLLKMEVILKAFMFWLGDEQSEHTSGRLGTGCSTMTPIISRVSRAILEKFSGCIQLPKSDDDIVQLMNGFILFLDSLTESGP